MRRTRTYDYILAGSFWTSIGTAMLAYNVWKTYSRRREIEEEVRKMRAEFEEIYSRLEER